MSRIGKIARLPFDIREQLNFRINNGESAVHLASWLNAQPKVREILATQFEGVPISEQNLSNWRSGGFLEWAGIQEWKAVCSSSVEEAAEISATGFNANSLLVLLTARIANIIHKFDENRSEHFPELIALQRLVGTVQRIHQSEQKDARLALDRERLDSQKTRITQPPPAAEATPPPNTAASPPPPPPEPSTKPSTKPSAQPPPKPTPQSPAQPTPLQPAAPSTPLPPSAKRPLPSFVILSEAARVPRALSAAEGPAISLWHPGLRSHRRV